MRCLSRFEAERQAIALMSHPNIAKLLDAGTTETGQPFFVMELVKGVPLTEFCDAHKLSVPDRLNLFRQICSAVHHAHQKGVIHRDLKPSNVLVESHDGKPVPKVIDFGLAKATAGLQLTEHTLFTAFGTVAGTPLYMAPEQATFNAWTWTVGRTSTAGRDPLRTARRRHPDPPGHADGRSTRCCGSSASRSRPREPDRHAGAKPHRGEPAVGARETGRIVRGELDWIV